MIGLGTGSDWILRYSEYGLLYCIYFSSYLAMMLSCLNTDVCCELASTFKVLTWRVMPNAGEATQGVDVDRYVAI